MMPESPKVEAARSITLAFTVQGDRRDYRLSVLEQENDVQARFVARATGTNALCETMLDDLAKAIQEFGPNVHVLVNTPKGTRAISTRTVEQLYRGELQATDLLI